MRMPQAFAALAAAALVSLPGGAAAEAETVQITLKEWDLGVQNVALKGGEATFEISNAGTAPHAFEIEGEIGGKEFEAATGELQPGEKTTLTIGLPAGEYEIYCPVEGHAEKGMKTTATFAGE